MNKLTIAIIAAIVLMALIIILYKTRKRERAKNMIMIFFLSLAIELITTPLRAMDFSICSVVTFALYFVFMIIVLHKYRNSLKPAIILLVALMGCSVLRLPLHILEFESSLVSLPDTLFHLFGILMGFLYYISKKHFKIIIAALSTFSCLFLHFKGYDMWIHKLSYGTYTGKIDTYPASNLKFTNEAGDSISLADMGGKYVVMDFWYSQCGVCFSKIPKTQTLYDQLKKDPDIVFYSINAKVDSDTEQYAFTHLKQLGYSLPVLRVNIKDSLLTKMGIVGYPTVLILDPNGNIVFRGGIESAEKYISEKVK